jgi:hypothetical protein
MSANPSFLWIFLVATAVLAVNCSGAQTSTSVAPGFHQPTVSQPLVVPGTLPSQQCQHSPDLQVVPCHLTFTRDRTKVISVEGSGSGYARLFDNCQSLASIYDVSGPAWIVRPEKTKGTCAAVFIHDRQFAILTIDDQL